MIADASTGAGRRTGAPCSPANPSISGGSHRATVRPPWGEASSVTSTHSRPTRVVAAAPASEVVAEARMKVGAAPMARASLSSRRRTRATLEPNTPR